MLLEPFGVTGLGQPIVFLNEGDELIEVFHGPLRVTKADGDFHPFFVNRQLAKSFDGHDFLGELVIQSTDGLANHVGHCHAGNDNELRYFRSHVFRKELEKGLFGYFNFHIVNLPKRFVLSSLPPELPMDTNRVKWTTIIYFDSHSVNLTKVVELSSGDSVNLEGVFLDKIHDG
jgi:hypothetical protein